MHRVIRSGEAGTEPGGTVTFEGEPYGSGVSFFLVNNEPGAGPDLHRHPYWRRGSSARADPVHGGRRGDRGGPGDIAVVGPQTPHKFKNIGEERLELVCIHASPNMIQEELE